MHLTRKEDYGPEAHKYFPPGIEIGTMTPDELDKIVSINKKLGVKKMGAIAQSNIRMGTYRSTAEFVQSCIDQYPDFFFGIAGETPLTVQNEFDKQALEDFKYAIDSLGFKALMLTSLRENGTVPLKAT